MTLQVLDCRECHGAELTGGTSLHSCDRCHQEGWRANCTYCHGGELTDRGAPPRQLDPDHLDETTSSFPAHTAHVSLSSHRPYDCVQCHQKPRDVLSNAHAFDFSPGVAEVNFSGGLSAGARWDGEGCSNTYCHGDGKENGSQSLAGDPPFCGGCHAVASSGLIELLTMSGEHREHWIHQVGCEDCHSTVGAGDELIRPVDHVDGQVNISMDSAITYENRRCTGSCHDEQHNQAPW